MNCKIILVDDHLIFRDGLRLVIEEGGLGEVIAEANNGLHFLEMVQNYKPDIVLMDIEMPIMNGMEATEKALSIQPNLKIIMLSMYGDRKLYSQLLNAGAKGFIIKTSGKKELSNAINNVMNGESHFSNDLLLKIIVDFNRKASINQNKYLNELKITKREFEVLELLCLGLSAKEVSDKLSISIKTIETHRSKLMQKTQTKNTINLVIYAIKHKLIEL